MSKVKLERELERMRKERKDVFDNNKALEDIKLLLAGDQQENLRILRGIGSRSTTIELEKENSIYIELENLEKEFQGSIFTTHQIRELCIKYRLRFLNSNLYTGGMNVEVAAKIKEFAKSTNTSIDEQTLARKFMILAPPEMFKLEEKKFEKTVDDPDPLIFYHIGEGRYRLIHKWGSDFSILRRFLGYRWRNLQTFWITNFFLLLPLVTLAVTLLLGAENMIQHWICTSLLIIVVNSFLATWMNSPVTDENWFDEEEGFFTETNWDSSTKLV